MTNEELAAITISNDFYMWGGVILGFILAGTFKTVSNLIANRFQRPRRIKFRHLQGREERKDNVEYLYLQGREERKDNVEYLYLYRGEYYTLEQRDFLKKQHLKNIKSITRFDIKFFLIFVLLIATMTVLFLKTVGLGI